MVRKKSIMINNRLLGSAILLGLIIQFILPRIGVHIETISIFIYLVVGFYLFLF